MVHLQTKGAKVSCRLVQGRILLLIFLVITIVGKKANFEKKRQTLNGRLPPEDSSVFDDSVCVLIVMT